MSSTLDSIIRRRKKENLKSATLNSSKASATPAKKEGSWPATIWIVVAVVIVLLLLFACWYFWRTPATKSSLSILDEMKNTTPNDCSKAVLEQPGVISLATFREYNNKFSRNFSETEADNF